MVIFYFQDFSDPIINDLVPFRTLIVYSTLMFLNGFWEPISDRMLHSENSPNLKYDCINSIWLFSIKCFLHSFFTLECKPNRIVVFLYKLKKNCIVVLNPFSITNFSLICENIHDCPFFEFLSDFDPEKFIFGHFFVHYFHISSLID